MKCKVEVDFEENYEQESKHDPLDDTIKIEYEETEIKIEVFDVDDLHHSIDIKEEDDVQDIQKAIAEKTWEDETDVVDENHPTHVFPDVVNLKRTFLCDSCDYLTTSKTNLITHIKDHTNENIYPTLITNEINCESNAVNVKRKYGSFTANEKRKILNKLEEGVRASGVAKEYQIHGTILSNWLKNNDKIELCGEGSTNAKRIRLSLNEEVNESVFRWYTEMTKKGLTIPGQKIKALQSDPSNLNVFKGEKFVEKKRNHPELLSDLVGNAIVQVLNSANNTVRSTCLSSAIYSPKFGRNKTQNSQLIEGSSSIPLSKSFRNFSSGENLSIANFQITSESCDEAEDIIQVNDDNTSSNPWERTPSPWYDSNQNSDSPVHDSDKDPEFLPDGSEESSLDVPFDTTSEISGVSTIFVNYHKCSAAETPKLQTSPIEMNLNENPSKDFETCILLQQPFVNDILVFPSASKGNEETIAFPSTSKTYEEHSVADTKRIRNKNFCVYCKLSVLNFARHIKRNHPMEEEVQKIFSLPLNSSERKNLLSSLRKKGNYIHNTVKCLKSARKPKFNDTELLPCTYCLGFYVSHQLLRHRKSCSQNPGDNTKHSRSDAQNSLVKHLSVDQQLRDRVFPHMRADRISLVAKKDALICTYGSRYMKTHKEKHFIRVTSKKMRELAKLLIEVMKLQPFVKNLFQVLRPEYFDTLIQATKIVGQYNSVKDIFESPTYVVNIQTALKQCCDIAHDLYNGVAEKDLQDMKQLLIVNWKFEICSQTANNVSLQKWDKDTLVPLASDVKVLIEYLRVTAEAAASKLLEENNNAAAYSDLLETIFCRIMLLNRKRPEELQRLVLQNYLKSEVGSQNNIEQFENVMTPTEKILFKRFKHVVTRGKRGGDVPILFSDDVQSHIELLIKVRSNFLDNANPYLFEKPYSKSCKVGYKILEKFVRLCGAENPSSLVSTRLRKHLVTLTQIFCMSENDLEQLAAFMEPTIGVRRLSYKLPDDVYQSVKILKLLLMETGSTDECKRKDLNLEGNLDTSDDENSTNLSPGSSAGNISKGIKMGIKRQLIPWTKQQKNVVQEYFKNHIEVKKAPKRWECDVLKKRYPEILENRSWLKIKVYVQNKYTKKYK